MRAGEGQLMHVYKLLLHISAVALKFKDILIKHRTLADRLRVCAV